MFIIAGFGGTVPMTPAERSGFRVPQLSFEFEDSLSYVKLSKEKKGFIAKCVESGTTWVQFQTPQSPQFVAGPGCNLGMPFEWQCRPGCSDCREVSLRFQPFEPCPSCGAAADRDCAIFLWAVVE